MRIYHILHFACCKKSIFVKFYVRQSRFRPKSVKKNWHTVKWCDFILLWIKIWWICFDKSLIHQKTLNIASWTQIIASGKILNENVWRLEKFCSKPSRYKAMCTFICELISTIFLQSGKPGRKFGLSMVSAAAAMSSLSLVWYGMVRHSNIVWYGIAVWYSMVGITEEVWSKYGVSSHRPVLITVSSLSLVCHGMHGMI